MSVIIWFKAGEKNKIHHSAVNVTSQYLQRFHGVHIASLLILCFTYKYIYKPLIKYHDFQKIEWL